MAVVLVCQLGCGGGSGKSQPSPPSFTSISVFPQAPTLAAGLKTQLTAAATASDGSVSGATNVSWSSSNTSVAKVSSQGIVTAVAAGTATITASVNSLQGQTTLTVPNGSGGWVLNSNSTDSLLLMGNDTSGEPVGVLGTRDSTGVPTAITSVKLTRADSSWTAIYVDSSYNPVEIYDSSGYAYDFHWSSATAGTLIARTLDGKYSVPVGFDLSASSSSKAKLRQPVPSPRKVKFSSLLNSNANAEVDVTRSCNPSVPESFAIVQITVTDANRNVTSYPANNTGNGSYTAELPVPPSAVITQAEALAEAAAASAQATTFCQSQSLNSTSKFSSLLSTAIALLGESSVPELAALSDGLGDLDTLRNTVCSVPGKLVSWLDRFTPLPITLDASATSDQDSGTATEQAPAGGPFANMNVQLACQQVESVQVQPSNLTLTEGGKPAALWGTPLDSNGLAITSSSKVITWDTSDANIAYPSTTVDSSAYSSSTGRVAVVQPVNPGTTTVTATETTSGKQGGATVTVNPCSGPLTSNFTPSSVVIPLPTCDSNGDCTAQAPPVTYNNTSQCAVTTGITGSGGAPSFQWQGYTYSVTWDTSCAYTVGPGQSCEFTFSVFAQPTTGGNTTNSTTLTITVEDNASKPSVQVTVTPLA